MKAPIKSKKHIVQFPFDGILTGVNQNIRLVDADNGTAAISVEEGAIVKAIFIELWLQNSANDGFAVVTITKDPQNSGGPSFTEMASLMTWNNKKNILFTHEGLTSNDGVGNPIRPVYGWFKIPKGKQRMGFEDKIHLSISNPSSNTLNRCGMAIYKEYT